MSSRIFVDARIDIYIDSVPIPIISDSKTIIDNSIGVQGSQKPESYIYYDNQVYVIV